jgi:hypothetical protein
MTSVGALPRVYPAFVAAVFKGDLKNEFPEIVKMLPKIIS